MMFEHIIKKIPGFESSYILNVASDFGVRSSRRVKTHYALTFEEGTREATFDDSIGMLGKPFGAFQVPYRQILPADLEDLYVVRKPHYKSGLRGMTLCMVTGEAAGTAAALAAKHSAASGEVDIRELQQTLSANNVKIRWKEQCSVAET